MKTGSFQRHAEYFRRLCLPAGRKICPIRGMRQTVRWEAMIITGDLLVCEVPYQPCRTDGLRSYLEFEGAAMAASVCINGTNVRP